jgi:hypothetical protein
MFDDFKELLSIFNAQKVKYLDNKEAGHGCPASCPKSNYAACITFFVRSFMSWGDTSSMCVATPHRCPNGS